MTRSPAAPHIPVMLPEVLDALALTTADRASDTAMGDTILVDATFGAGGYSRALLDIGASVHAFDRDPDAIAEGAKLLDEAKGRLILHHARFSELADRLQEAGIKAVDGVVFDIGVSSMQIDRSERGFSFQSDGPIDMRMGQSGESAADFVNTADEAVIADIIYLYGEERQSRRIARAIVSARPLTRTHELAAVVRKAAGYRPGAPKDPATRTFQALRIHINGELDELKLGLDAAERILRPGGRLVVVSFHSLEDRLVKQFLRERSGSQAGGSRHLPQVRDSTPSPSFEKPSKAIRAGKAESDANPRARSAVLRWARRTPEAPWSGRMAA